MSKEQVIAKLSANKESEISTTITSDNVRISYKFEPVAIADEMCIQITMKKHGDKEWSTPILIPDIFVSEIKKELDDMSAFIDKHLV